MIVTLEKSRTGGLMAKFDDFICFFDRRSRYMEKEYDPEDEVNVMFTGISRNNILFMSPIRKDFGHKLIRHKGFKPTSPTWDIIAEATFPKHALIKLGKIPIPFMDGRNTNMYPGNCWVKSIGKRKYQCVGVDNPWVLDFNNGRFTIGE